MLTSGSLKLPLPAFLPGFSLGITDEQGLLGILHCAKSAPRPLS